MMDRETIQAISDMIKENLQPINEKLELMESDIKSLKNNVGVLGVKHDSASRKLEEINLQVATIDYKLNRLIVKNEDEHETLIAVLQQHNFIPQ